MGRRGGGRRGGGRRGGGRRGGGRRGGGRRGGGRRGGGGGGHRRGGAKRRGVHVRIGHGNHHHRRMHHHHHHRRHRHRRRFGHHNHIHYGYHRYYYGGHYYYYRHGGGDERGAPKVLPMPDNMSVHDTFVNQNIVGAECAGVGYPEWMTDSQITQELGNRGLTQEKFGQEIATINNKAYWGGYQCERYLNHLPTILIVLGVLLIIISLVQAALSVGTLVVAILLLVGGCVSYCAVQRYSVNSYYDRIYDVEQHLNTLNSTYTPQRIRWEIVQGSGAGNQLSIHAILVRPLDQNGQLLAGALVNTLMKDPPADTDWNSQQQMQPQVQVVVQQPMQMVPVQGQVMIPVQGQQVVMQPVQGQVMQPMQGQVMQPVQGQQMVMVAQPQPVMIQPQQVVQQPMVQQPMIQQQPQQQQTEQPPQYQTIQEQAQNIGN